MSPLAIRIGAGVLALLALLTLRRQRWAYVAFVALGLAYFPAQTAFQIHAPKCEQLISQSLALLSLHNYAHIALFAGFYWMSWVQFRRTRARVLWAFLATVLMGALVEIAEGVTGRGNCRVRDLAPDAAGALGAAIVLAIWSRLTRKPAYVRLVKKTVSPSKVPPPPPQPLKGLPTVPTTQAAPAAPPAPELSPTFAEPTEEVAPRGEILNRLRTGWQRVVAMLPTLWGAIRRRRRAIAVGIGVLVFVAGAAVVVLVVLPSPEPAPVAEQPPELPPAPAPRPLQVEAEGYYEPDYQFTVADRRFTRLTLKPAAFLTFARFGGRQESGCADARIGQSTVYLRCEVERVGIVTIDGRFTSRFATSRLDAGVLSAFITVKNPRGEVVYRARGSFRWHEPD